jgi:hypothetical protein
VLKLYRPPVNDLEEAQKRKDQDEVFEFLAILEPSYDSVRSRILLMSELPPLDEVVAILEREETRRIMIGQQSTEQLEVRAFLVAAVVAKPSQYQNPRFNYHQVPRCKHYNKDGHTQEACWHLHPELRPKGPRYGGDQRQGERAGENHYEKKKIFLTEANEGSTQVNHTKGLAQVNHTKGLAQVNQTRGLAQINPSEERAVAQPDQMQ